MYVDKGNYNSYPGGLVLSQIVLSGPNAFLEVSKMVEKWNARKAFIVCGPFFDELGVASRVKVLGFDIVRFTNFTANPTIEQVKEGIKLFCESKCDLIIAVGGGSAMDVAKCIKLFHQEKIDGDILSQPHKDTGVPLVCIPTTAGTGSESTRYAVVYKDGVKQSVADESIIPSVAVLDGKVLRGLPVFQKKCTLLDALCQAIEAFWSVNSTDESKKYSIIAIQKIISNYKEYLLGNDGVNDEILLGANYAGRAINITQTTGAHAMSYKITSLFGLPHGYAVAVCLPTLWEYMVNNTQNCIDERGEDYLKSVFDEIANVLGYDNSICAIQGVKDLLKEMELDQPVIPEDKLNELVKSVNPTRLKINPVKLDERVIKELYERISRC